MSKYGAKRGLWCHQLIECSVVLQVKPSTWSVTSDRLWIIRLSRSPSTRHPTSRRTGVPRRASPWTPPLPSTSGATSGQTRPKSKSFLGSSGSSAAAAAAAVHVTQHNSLRIDLLRNKLSVWGNPTVLTLLERDFIINRPCTHVPSIHHCGLIVHIVQVSTLFFFSLCLN